MSTNSTPVELVVVEFSTEHFTFTAAGFSTDEADAALERGLRKHAEQHDLAKDWWHGYVPRRVPGNRPPTIAELRAECCEGYVVRAGSCYRDGSTLTEAA